MHLDGAGGHHARDRTLDCLRDRLRLRFPARDQDELARLENRADAHRDRVDGHVLAPLEEARVVVDRLLRERFEARARRQRAGGLVESDVPVGADAEDLDVDPAALGDAALVPLAKRGIVAGRAGRDVDVLRLDVDVPEKVLVHEVVIALRMIHVQSNVLVEIERRRAREIELPLLVQPHELLVEAERRRAGRHAEHGVGLRVQHLHDDFGRYSAQALVVSLNDDFHYTSSHALARASAFCQPRSSFCRSADFMAGVKRRSTCHCAAICFWSFPNPTARPAGEAAPSAVVSVTLGRTTGTPSRLDWNCIRRLFADAPPSTRSSLSLIFASACMARRTSATWNAMPSSAARAMCAAVVPRVTPATRPRAYWSQCGAPSPANAGTRYTPSGSVTCAASASTSDEDLMMPSPSRSHCTTAPAMKIEPSSAYSVRSPTRQATVVSRLFFDGTGFVPVFISMKQPVPNVFFTMPGCVHAWPNRAACWSPAIPAMGSVPPNSVVSP